MKTQIGSSISIVPNRTITRARWQFLSLIALLALTLLPTLNVSAAGSGSIVFAEVYGSGGNTGAAYKRDYVVLFNRGATAQSINGWSLQYSASTSSSWGSNKRSLPNATIPAGGYFLVSLALVDGANGAALPAIDFTVSSLLDISGSNGKIALCSDTVSLTAVANPTDTNIVDKLGYGGATGFETAAAPVQSAANASVRASGGCTDTDNNSLDFTSTAPNPKNSSSPFNNCGGGSAVAITVGPKNSTNWPGSTATFTATVTGDAPITYYWQSNSVTLANGGAVSGATTNTLTISPVSAGFETTYQLIVSNLLGAATSSVVNLVILSNAPSIDSNPLSRTGIAGKTATFQVLTSVSGNPIGAPAAQYRWQGNGVDIVDGGRFSGAGTPKLTITGIIAGTDELTYTCIASNSVGAATSSGASLTVATTGTLAFWNFNIATNPATPEVYYGVGGASLAGITNGFFAIADDGNDPGDPTKYWGTSQYPSNPILPATNKTTGVRFDVDTTGLRNVMFTLSTRLTTSASKYSRLQYTTDGTTFTDYPGSSTYTGLGSTWDSTGSGPANAGRIFDLSGFAGVANNPNFGVRVVTETENTATYGTSTTTNFVGLSAGYSANGTVSYDLVDFEASTIIGNAAPTIGAISSFSILDSASPTNITLSIADTDDSLGTLAVTAKSFNSAVIPDSLSPSTTTLTITPSPGNTGTSPILLKVVDPSGNAAVVTFNVTVVPGNATPTIVGLVNTNTFTNTAVSQTFSINDDGGVGALTVSTFSGNTTLVPNGNTTVTGTGGTRTNTVIGLAGSNGVAPIKVVVTDTGSPAKSATNSYAVIIRSSTNTLAVDSFDYDTDGALNTNSAFIWQTHSGTAGQVDVTDGKMILGIPSNDGEDVNFPLFGAPWSTNTSAVLYSSYKAKWLNFPGSVGTYMSHFMDTNTGVATGFGARVWASTNLATTPDSFNLSIVNGQGGTNFTAKFPLDLQTNVEYLVVTKFVLSNGVATLWINPTSESSTNITATDVSNTNAVKNAIDVVAYAFRQSTTDGGSGAIAVDDFKVALSFAEATGLAAAAPTPVPLVITNVAGNAIVSWNDPTGLFRLVSGTNLLGATNPTSTTSPYTNAVSGQRYFRLIYP